MTGGFTGVLGPGKGSWLDSDLKSSTDQQWLQHRLREDCSVLSGGPESTDAEGAGRGGTSKKTKVNRKAGGKPDLRVVRRSVEHATPMLAHA